MERYQDIVKLWQGLPIRTEADLDTYMDSFKVLFAYNSNKIENVNTTYEIFDKGKVSGTGQGGGSSVLYARRMT